MSFLANTLKLLRFNTPHGYENVMTEFLIKELTALNFEVIFDEIGNLYATRGKAKQYPLLNAHMDIVENYTYTGYSNWNNNIYSYYGKNISTERTCKNCMAFDVCAEELVLYNEIPNETTAKLKLERDGDAIFCKYFENKTTSRHYSYYDEEEEIEKTNQSFKVIYDKEKQLIRSNKLRILGGDDKCGMAITLQVAKEMIDLPIKIFFSVGEESGCIGVKHAITQHKSFFEDCKYGVTIDRNGGEDLIVAYSGKYNGTLKFLSLVAKQGVLSEIWVRCTTGSVADTTYLREVITDCCNISAGYYNAHTVDEYVNFKEMCQIKDWVKRIVKYI
jgi:putative aminopeptidase FrvX